MKVPHGKPILVNIHSIYHSIPFYLLIKSLLFDFRIISMQADICNIAGV